MSVKFSFTQTRKITKLGDSKFRDESTKDQVLEQHFVHSIEGNEIKGTLKKKVKQELVIPLITKNNWRKLANIDTEEDDSNLTVEQRLERQAVKELLGNEQDSEERSDSVIPLLLQNRIPNGFEEEDHMDVSLRPEQSTLEDYERVPINEFGMAMLRGMGWTKKDGIGLKNKQHVEIKIAEPRPKGLGLGAEKPWERNDRVDDRKEERVDDDRRRNERVDDDRRRNERVDDDRRRNERVDDDRRRNERVDDRRKEERVDDDRRRNERVDDRRKEERVDDDRRKEERVDDRRINERVDDRRREERVDDDRRREERVDDRRREDRFDERRRDSQRDDRNSGRRDHGRSYDGNNRRSHHHRDRSRSRSSSPTKSKNGKKHKKSKKSKHSRRSRS